MKLSRLEIIKTVIFTLIILGVLIFVFLPNFNRLKKVSTAFETELANLQNATQHLITVDESQREYEAANASLPDFNSIFTKAGDELSLITSLEDIAAANNVDPKIQLGTEKLPVSDTVAKTPVTLKTNGSYADIYNYVREIQNIRYKIQIDKLSISHAADENIQAIFSGYVYWNTAK